jgi:hypothetical protein
MTIPIISTFYSVTDEQNKERPENKKNEEQQAQDIHAINYPFEHFLTDEQLNNTLSNSIFDFETACKSQTFSLQSCHSTSLHLIVHDDVCTTCIQKTEREYQDSYLSGMKTL